VRRGVRRDGRVEVFDPDPSMFQVGLDAAEGAADLVGSVANRI
jgi:hypothetical protein